MTTDLAKLKDRRSLWETVFSKDKNSIVNQILETLWNAAVFRVINESRRIAEEENRHLNGPLHEAINQNFWAMQFQAIRRLTEGGQIHGKNGVCSLRTLIVDMQACRPLMTRQNFLAMEGLEYDLANVNRNLEALVQSKKGEVFWAPPELSRPEQLHQTFDQLSQTAPLDRKPTDVVSPKIFEALLARLEAAWPQDFEEYVNKFVSHAATPASRETTGAGNVLPTYGALQTAHVAICRTANFVGDFFLKGGGLSLPFPQFNHLENIEQPLVSAQHIPRLSEEWDKYEKEIKKCIAWDFNSLLP